jgi:two-component SAPR family response regulator
MVGLVYLSKKHMAEGIEFVEKALKKAPWQKEWQDNLLKAYELAGEEDKAAKLKEKMKRRRRRRRAVDTLTALPDDEGNAFDPMLTATSQG